MIMFDSSLGVLYVKVISACKTASEAASPGSRGVPAPPLSTTRSKPPHAAPASCSHECRLRVGVGALHIKHCKNKDTLRIKHYMIRTLVYKALK